MVRPLYAARDAPPLVHTPVRSLALFARFSTCPPLRLDHRSCFTAAASLPHLLHRSCFTAAASPQLLLHRSCFIAPASPQLLLHRICFTAPAPPHLPGRDAAHDARRPQGDEGCRRRADKRSGARARRPARRRLLVARVTTTPRRLRP
eukprot:6186577-Prymnesium_polylepis.1